MKMLSHDQSLVLYQAGRQAERIGKFNKAKYYICLAVSVEPDNAAYIRAAAALARQMDRQEDAKVLYSEAVEAARRAAPYPNAAVTSLVCEALAG